MQPLPTIFHVLSCRRIAKATGGRVVLTLADMEGNETFDPAALGTADEVAEIRVADDAMVSQGAWHGAHGVHALGLRVWVRMCVL